MGRFIPQNYIRVLESDVSSTQEVKSHDLADLNVDLDKVNAVTWRDAYPLKVNAVTWRDAYPLPYINATLDSLAGAQYFSTLDLASGNWQVEMEEEDKEKTAGKHNSNADAPSRRPHEETGNGGIGIGGDSTTDVQNYVNGDVDEKLIPVCKPAQNVGGEVACGERAGKESAGKEGAEIGRAHV